MSGPSLEREWYDGPKPAALRAALDAGVTFAALVAAVSSAVLRQATEDGITTGGPTNEWADFDPRTTPEAGPSTWRVTASGDSGAYRVNLAYDCLTWQPQLDPAGASVIPTINAHNGHSYSSFDYFPGALTGTVEPVWPTGEGDTVADGDLTWTNAGLVPNIMLINVGDNEADCIAALDQFPVVAGDWSQVDIGLNEYQAIDAGVVYIQDDNLVGGSVSIEQTAPGNGPGLVRPFGSRVLWVNEPDGALLPLRQTGDPEPRWGYDNREIDPAAKSPAVWHISASADSGTYDVILNGAPATIAVGDDVAAIQAAVDAAVGPATFTVNGDWNNWIATTVILAWFPESFVTVDDSNLVGEDGTYAEAEQTRTGQDTYTRRLPEQSTVPRDVTLTQGEGTPQVATDNDLVATVVYRSRGTLVGHIGFEIGAGAGDGGEQVTFTVPLRSVDGSDDPWRPGGGDGFPMGTWLGTVGGSGGSGVVVFAGNSFVLCDAVGAPVTDALVEGDTLFITLHCVIYDAD